MIIKNGEIVAVDAVFVGEGLSGNGTSANPLRIDTHKSYLLSVSHDETLSGTGHEDSPLGIANSWTKVITDIQSSATSWNKATDVIQTSASVWNTAITSIQTSANVWNTVPKFSVSDKKIYGLQSDGTTSKWVAITGGGTGETYSAGKGIEITEDTEGNKFINAYVSANLNNGILTIDNSKLY